MDTLVNIVTTNFKQKNKRAKYQKEIEEKPSNNNVTVRKYL